MSYTSFDNIGLVKSSKSIFQTHKSEYLSKEDLSDVLKISRVAVWKHIKKFKHLAIQLNQNKNWLQID